MSGYPLALNKENLQFLMRHEKEGRVMEMSLSETDLARLHNRGSIDTTLFTCA